MHISWQGRKRWVLSHVDKPDLVGRRQKRPRNRRAGVGLCACWWVGERVLCNRLSVPREIEGRVVSQEWRKKWGSQRFEKGRLGRKHVPELIREMWYACQAVLRAHLRTVILNTRWNWSSALWHFSIKLSSCALLPNTRESGPFRIRFLQDGCDKKTEQQRSLEFWKECSGVMGYKI